MVAALLETAGFLSSLEVPRVVLARYSHSLQLKHQPPPWGPVTKVVKVTSRKAQGRDHQPLVTVTRHNAEETVQSRTEHRPYGALSWCIVHLDAKPCSMDTLHMPTLCNCQH